jgi:hypothetical protein
LTPSPNERKLGLWSRAEEKMSLRNLGIHCDMACLEQGSGSWQQQDVDLLKSEKGLAKIYRSFDKTTFDFNINILMQKHAVFDSDKLNKIIPSEQLVDPTAINVCHTTNVTTNSNYIPMNAWIMVHRMAHANQARGYVSEQSLIDTLAEAYERLTGDKAKVLSGRIQGFGRDLEALLMLLMTMRSARMCNISSDLDFLGELLAQYVITGKISLLPVEGWDQRIDIMNAVKDRQHLVRSHYQVIDNLYMKSQERYTARQLSEELAYLERDLNMIVHGMLTQCMGKLIHF